MLKLFGCLGVLVLGVFLLAAALVGSVWRILLDFLGLRKSASHHQRTAGEARHQSTTSTSQGTASSTNGTSNSKIFKRDESEYVEFEEYREHP